MKKDATGTIKFKLKERPIKFGSHRDAAILEYYTRSLSLDYEEYLSSTPFRDSILAYRSDVGNNIEHSKSLFDEIRYRKKCIAIAMDISGFFDNISHQVLYQQLRRIRRSERLPEVDYVIFKRMTSYEWVDSKALTDRLGDVYGRAGRICYPQEFRRLVRQQKPSLVQRNVSDRGIPQGTPLSGAYANISLLQFDNDMTQRVGELGGTYRRYSDDIAFVLPRSTNVDDFVEMVAGSLLEIGLEVSSGKTEVSRFDVSAGKLAADRPFQYLGFTFDGSRTLIRQSSLSNYYGKMNRGIRAKIHAAKKNGVPQAEIYMRELFRKYTHFGQYRNFPRYAYKAAQVHESRDIRKQLSRHVSIFKEKVRDAINDIY